MPAIDERRTVSAADLLALIQSFLAGGWKTSEFWALVVGAALSVGIDRLGVSGPEAVQVVTVLTPVVTSWVYAGVRTLFKASVAKSAGRLSNPVA